MRAAFLLVLLLDVAMASPVATIRNAAARYGLPSGEAAPRSFIEVSVSESDPMGTPVWIDWSIPVSITVQAAGTAAPVDVEVIGKMTFTGVLAALPDGLAPGPATITMTYNDGDAASGEFEILPTSFALFNVGDGALLAPAVAQNVVPGQELEVNGLTRPALPGTYLTLWGTGLGSAGTEDVLVELGGVAVPVLYAGPSPSSPYLDQVNIAVPDDDVIPDGCYVTLDVEANGRAANVTTITKSRTGLCDHPMGLSAEQMALLDAGGTVAEVSVNVSSSIFSAQGNLDAAPEIVRSESGNAYFLKTDAAGIAVLSRSSEQISESDCRVVRPASGMTAGWVRSTNFVSAGDKLTFEGPEGRSVDFEPGDPDFVHGIYSTQLEQSAPVTDPADLPPPFFTAADWLLSGPGSEDMEPFQLTIRVPPPIELTNFAEARVIDRATDLTLTWETMGYWESDVFSIYLSGKETIVNGSESEANGIIGVQCAVKALDGLATIPASLLQDFDSTVAEGGSAAFLSVHLAGTPPEERRFSLQLTDGNPLPGQLTVTTGFQVPVEIQ